MLLFANTWAPCERFLRQILDPPVMRHRNKMHFFKTYSYEIQLDHRTESMPSSIQGIRWTPLPDIVSQEEYSQTVKQVISHKVWRAAKVLYTYLLSMSPTLMRDRKHHFRNHRHCCSGKELVDWLIGISPGIQSRSQALGIWQVLVDEGFLVHVRQELNFQDKESQFYRFFKAELFLGSSMSERDSEDELHESLVFLAQLGPAALLTMILRKPPYQRTEEELEVIFEELLHIKAVSHLSNSVKRELASVLVFESHAKAGTVLFSQGDKGTSWYIIWKGSVNVVTHGKGLVATLHEGDDFGQLALVNDAPRAATIVLREDNCHFLRVDKHDFNRILRDVEANTVRLKEHGKVVLVLEKSPQISGNNLQTPAHNKHKYTVMSGTADKILEHLLETMRSDSTPNNLEDSLAANFLLTHSIFMPTSQLCQALLHQFHMEPSEVNEPEKANYSLHKRQNVLRLVSLWVTLYGRLLDSEPSAKSFLEKLSESVSRDPHLFGFLRENVQDRRKTRTMEASCGNNSPQIKIHSIGNLFSSLEDEHPGNSYTIQAYDKVPYDIYRTDHSCITILLPVNASVQEVITSLTSNYGCQTDQILAKVNSSGEQVCLKHEDIGVFTSLGVNERLFICYSQELATLSPLPEQMGPNSSSYEILDLISSKDLANQMTDNDWNLFKSIHQVELLYHTFGKQKFRNTTTANLERFMKHFNEVQFWVVTEVCLCNQDERRAQLLRKFIKLAANLKEQKNLNSFFAVMFGLSNTAVSRLSRTWQRLPNKTRKLYSIFERLMDPSWNHRSYRLAVAKLSPPLIPFLPLILKDLTFLHEGNRSTLENLVNFEKMRMVSKTLQMFHHYRSQAYIPLSPLRSRPIHILEETNTARISACSEHSMTLRSPATTWAYIQHMKVIDNQKRLMELSRNLEPP
ncbi:rap guanine nucleotide exchange factor 3 [Bombina bombina]|uniref:rap guanine nucleotide exchange factor 3 n=1 Tax=Bombina bombina TaxID=8345 RepID=UPI00235A47A4|nr:rap guanine nucleotide exchange factor 3 [Bombina bombina]